MNTIMDDSNISTLEQMKKFLEGTQHVALEIRSIDEKYRWVASILVRFEYLTLSKKKKGIIFRYLRKLSGYSRQQLSRLIFKYEENGVVAKETQHRPVFPKRYTSNDLALLIKTDQAHDRLSGPATKKILERECQVFGHREYEKIAQISVSHLYNLRQSKPYLRSHTHFEKTRPIARDIGERTKPDPQGRPGYLRVDTVHQGDLDKVKGVYHINLVDEVTQFELVASVEKISESHMVEVLAALLTQFPFKVIECHSDNGSEYINKVVVKLLNRLLIRLTKSRARHTNDNALVECKNGAVLRKHLGYAHIPQKFACEINGYYQTYFNVYVNFHRPCFFPEIQLDWKGKQRKVYRYENLMTPYEKLKSHPKASSFLRQGVTFEKLDAIAYQMSDNEFACQMMKAREHLFEKILKKSPP